MTLDPGDALAPSLQGQPCHAADSGVTRETGRQSCPIALVRVGTGQTLSATKIVGSAPHQGGNQQSGQDENDPQRLRIME